MAQRVHRLLAQVKPLLLQHGEDYASAMTLTPTRQREGVDVVHALRAQREHA